MYLPFLLEIGSEEIPDWMIQPALKNLEELFTTVLKENNLGGAVTAVEATPRRLVLRAEGLNPAQPNETKATLGPSKSAGPGAAQGFAKKMGVTLADLEIITSPKGEYYNFSKAVEGRKTVEILAEVLPGIIGKIYFPKTMYWTGKGGARFIRPIRWLVALLGDDVVPFEFAEVKSGSISSGHRRLGAAKVPVTVVNHEEQLRANGVILSAAERRALIEKGLDSSVKKDEALLNTLVYLTECPATIRGTFDPQYLALPQEILTTVMRHHQRYFSVEDGEGKLAASFVAVMNISSDPDGLVRLGNERVLRARFNDARFFWNVDQQKKLSDRVEDLKNVTFQAKLGSYFEKTTRVVVLAKELAAATGADTKAAARAAELLKADLTTDMVKELTELQGIVGGLYARAQGESEEVSQAIYDHYKPVGMDDSIPSTLTGQVVALADKLDTLKGCFGVGMMPTGSKDPFALRRAAQGVVKIIVEGKLPLPLSTLDLSAELKEFLLDRARFYFKEVRGFKYDEINAVLASGNDDLVDVESRLSALAQVRPTENFEPLAASFKRIQNILRQANVESGAVSAINPALVEPGPEAELHREFVRLREIVDAKRKAHDYRTALENIASLRPKVDLFFDKILVNDPDEKVRQNRLALLNSLLTEFSAIADFSEIVTQH
jgi:glycyl-tRNA synthetase beta chain